MATSKGKEDSKATRHYVDETADSRTPSPDPDFSIFHIRTVKDTAERSIKVDPSERFSLSHGT